MTPYRTVDPSKLPCLIVCMSYKALRNKYMFSKSVCFNSVRSLSLLIFCSAGNSILKTIETQIYGWGMPINELHDDHTPPILLIMAFVLR